MDKSWMNLSRVDSEYDAGVERFLDFAYTNHPGSEKICCPCVNCVNVYWNTRETVREHLICDGILHSYTCWVFHGESFPTTSASLGTLSHPQSHHQDDVVVREQFAMDGDMEGLLRNAFEINNDDVVENEIQDADNVEFPMSDVREPIFDTNESSSTPNIQDQVMSKLFEAASKQLYEGCSRASKLSFAVNLYHFKCLHGWSTKSFSALLGYLNLIFPHADIPRSSVDFKKFIKDLGLGYEKIHACPNDCMLYWGEDEGRDCCYVCGTSRWVAQDVGCSNRRRRKPAKILRYFPLIPRLKRLFMSEKTAECMTWHDVGRCKDGLLRHPADAEAWKYFDSHYPEFASETRNVRLGLASDGFNPFSIMSTSYSTWPVVLIPYNLPPWLCMKQSSLILSMIIPGEKGPGNDIDVYLQPLIKELKQLWEGVNAYDASKKQTFILRAALLWTINDFPAYANLSGWSTKGRYACPVCGGNTVSHWLENGRKFCYMGHRRWLDQDHVFRFQKRVFDGTEELRRAPTPLSGSEILDRLEGYSFTYGKTTDKQSRRRVRVQQSDNSFDLEMDENMADDDDPNDGELWKKRSIFFSLPYWKHNLLRHNIDVMHTEKNVCESVVMTLFNDSRKSKDNLKARLDLMSMGIRPELHPQCLPNGKVQMPAACYLLTREEKEIVCKVIRYIKVPDGYASNLSKCVNMKDRKLQNLKSHDYHVLMQDILPIALRRSMCKQVATVLIELCNIFKVICAKVLKVEDLQRLQSRAAITLCHLEKIFPPSFFTIMVHLVIHLPHEAILGGPVNYRWMYPIERCLAKYKSYVRNRAHPEGSIAEGHIAEECLTFCSRYLASVETRFSRPSRNPNVTSDIDSKDYLFNTYGSVIGKSDVIVLDQMTWSQATRYVLDQHDNITPFRLEYQKMLKRRARPRRLSNHEIDKLTCENFHMWLKDLVMGENDVSEDIKWLAQGPSYIAKRYSGFAINGYRFLTKNRERMKRTQNYGIVVSSSTMSYASARDTNPIEGNVDYYGQLTDIIELDYYNKAKVILFRCDWADVATGRGIKVDELGFTIVSFERLIHTGEQLTHEPFVLSSQVKQVFYSEDPKNEGWHVVIHNSPRDCFNLGEDEDTSGSERDHESSPFPSQMLDENVNETSEPIWVRNDVTDDVFDD